MEILVILIVSIAIFIDLLLLFFWTTNFKTYAKKLENYPTVDVLIAARNEEDTIIACLDSLLALDYPKDKLVIWVGDDASTDNTWMLIDEYCSKHVNIQGLQITKNIAQCNGKANVLAQLTNKSKGDWIFITDADIQVPKQWVQAMLVGAQAELITGTTLIEGNTWLATFQRLDWLYSTAMLKVVSDMGFPVTSLGNNMAYSRKVYNEIGGFENLPFSITEDLELLKGIKKNHKAINMWSGKVLNKSAPIASLGELLQQRKRWMRGAFNIPKQLVAILLVQAFYLPAIIVFIVLNPLVGVSLWLTKWLLKYMFGVIAAKKLEEKVSIFDSFVAEIFSMVFSMVSLVYYFWPSKINWKGRTY